MSERYQPNENYEAHVVEDSISPEGVRLTSMEVTFPRMVLAEFNTHRVFSRNSASSRAIPTHRRLTDILEKPYIPIEWGKYMPGMSSAEIMTPANQETAEELWLEMRDRAVLGTVALMGGIESPEISRNEILVARLLELEDEYGAMRSLDDEALHKQWVNRPLEPFMWHTVLVTATEWDNYYALRISQHAQPEINRAAELMLDAHESSTPKPVEVGGWHAPLMQEDEDDMDEATKMMVSSARSARISYMTHHGIRDTEADVTMYNRLYSAGHMSPFEHVATPFTPEDTRAIKILRKSNYPDHIIRNAEFDGNFRGWHQHRKTLPNEDNFGARVEK